MSIQSLPQPSSVVSNRDDGDDGNMPSQGLAPALTPVSAWSATVATHPGGSGDDDAVDGSGVARKGYQYPGRPGGVAPRARIRRLFQEAVPPHPRLVRSWALTTGALSLASAAAIAIESAVASAHTRAAQRRIGGGRRGLGSARWQDTGRLASVLAALFGLSALDTYLHLSMNRPPAGGQPYTRLGLPSTLTLIRRGISDYLWAHLLVGRPATSGHSFVALLAAGLTDMIDGAVARVTRRTTRLGAYLDGIADGSFWLALTCTMAARRQLPRWLLPLLLARWVAPVVFAAITYCRLGRPVPLGSTLAGKGAAITQALTLGVALSPRPLPRRVAQASRALHVLIVVFLVAAPLAQLRRMLRGR